MIIMLISSGTVFMALSHLIFTSQHIMLVNYQHVLLGGGDSNHKHLLQVLPLSWSLLPPRQELALLSLTRPLLAAL